MVFIQEFPLYPRRNTHALLLAGCVYQDRYSFFVIICFLVYIGLGEMILLNTELCEHRSEREVRNTNSVKRQSQFKITKAG